MNAAQNTEQDSAHPAAGSLWEIRNESSHVVYRLESTDNGEDPTYRYRLRLIEIKRTKSGWRTVGVDYIDVELDWFSVRSDVRKVSST